MMARVAEELGRKRWYLQVVGARIRRQSRHVNIAGKLPQSGQRLPLVDGRPITVVRHCLGPCSLVARRPRHD